MLLHVVLVNILFSVVLAHFGNNGPLLDGFISSRKPTKYDAEHRKSKNYQLDEWVIKHLFDVPNESSKYHDSSIEGNETNETFDDFPRSSSRRFDGLNENQERSESRRLRRHFTNDLKIDIDGIREIKVADTTKIHTPHVVRNDRLRRYENYAKCKYTIEGVTNSGMKHIKCKQTGKITEKSGEHHYCVQTFTKIECMADRAKETGNTEFKLYTGCMYLEEYTPQQDDIVIR